MLRISRGKPTHSDQLERWLGAEHVARLSKDFEHFYWPVPIHGVPGNVYIMPGGDFAGEIRAGAFMSAADAAALTVKKILKRIDSKARKNKALGVLHDLIRAGDRRCAAYPGSYPGNGWRCLALSGLVRLPGRWYPTASGRPGISGRHSGAARIGPSGC